MYYQLEVTTRCNYDCYYCAGRLMPQRDMSWDIFQSIIDAIPEPRVTISLQGEGEPSLHPMFEQMAECIRARGHQPYTILNGSQLDPFTLPILFPSLGISIDTLDPALAKDIGRHNLPKVLRNLDALCRVMSPSRISIMTVDMGQPLESLREWVAREKFRTHVVQPLSPKSDYARRYTISTDLIKQPQGSRTCRFLDKPRHRFFTWDGRELPCPFMKDPTDYTTRNELQLKLKQGCHMRCCHQCPNANVKLVTKNAEIHV